MNFKTDNRSLLIATGLAKNTKNSITKHGVLHTLSHYPHPDVRKLVAKHNNTHKDTLHKLSDHTDPFNTDDVRIAVANHNNTHQDTLHKLASDPLDFVRRGVASNNNTHKDTLHKLSDHTDSLNTWQVRRGVAKHKNTHQDTLHKLSDDPSEYVRRAANKQLREYINEKIN